MIVYIILHFKVLDETATCIQSIKEIMGKDSRIIIIDNFSNNGTGEKLQELYRKDPAIDVLINKENLGFANGNNIAYKYAKETYNPKFMFIMNNDIEIVNHDFEEFVQQIYKEEEFYILGPDIFSTTYHLHQNPKRLESYTKEEVVELKDKYSKSKEVDLKLKLKCYLKSIEWLRNLVYSSRNKGLEIDFTKKYYNVPLHGSFVIYSEKYIINEEYAFSPGTFFYYETEILDYICKEKGYKTIYDPKLKVLHHQNASTNVVYRNMLEKTLFSNENNYKSTSHFLEVIEEFERG